MSEKIDVRLIAIDIDDTLLNDKKVIPIQNIETIKKATEKGIKIILASGRPFALVTERLYSELGLLCDGNYYVGYNGESIYDVNTKKCLFSNSLDENDILYLENIFNRLDTNVARYVHLDDNVTVINANKYSYIEYEYNLKSYEVADFNKIKNIKAHKYQLASDPVVIKEIFEKIPAAVKEKYSVVISMPCFVEFMKKGVDKYQGILKVSKILNISEKHIMTIGDSMNDYSMIKNASYGVAMGNSNDDVKRIAKIITNNNNEAGVSSVIEKYVV